MLAQLSADQGNPDSREEWCAFLLSDQGSDEVVDRRLPLLLGSAITRSFISFLSL